MRYPFRNRGRGGEGDGEARDFDGDDMLKKDLWTYLNNVKPELELNLVR